MDQSFSAIITSRDGACALIKRSLEDLDDAVFALTVFFITRDEGFSIIGRKKDLRAARQIGCWDARASERGT